MVAVNIGDQDEVGLRESCEFHGLGGIQVDRLATRLDQRAGVVQGSDLDGTGGGGEGLRLSCSVRQEQRKNGENNNQQCFHSEPHIRLTFRCHAERSMIVPRTVTRGWKIRPG